MSLGGGGLWIWVVKLLALRRNLWPKPLNYVGMVGAVGFWLVLAQNVFGIRALGVIAAVAAVILAPIWYVWLGIMLQQATRARQENKVWSQ